MANKVVQFEGDIRLWLLNIVSSVRTAVNPDATDPHGNIPIEASAAIFQYEAGDERTVESKRRDRYKLKIYSDQDPGTSSISLTLVAIPGAILARLFYGDAAVTTVAEGSVTNEAVTITALGTPYRLSKRYLKASPAPVVTNVAGDTTYVAGTDYTINARTGEITATTGGAIDAADVVHVDFSYVAYELVSIRGGVRPVENFYITGDMLNRPDKSDLYLEVYQANLSNDGDVDLFSDEPITVTLAGPLITPEGKTEPYKVEALTKAA